MSAESENHDNAATEQLNNNTADGTQQPIITTVTDNTANHVNVIQDNEHKQDNGTQLSGIDTQQ